MTGIIAGFRVNLDHGLHVNLSRPGPRSPSGSAGARSTAVAA